MYKNISAAKEAVSIERAAKHFTSLILYRAISWKGIITDCADDARHTMNMGLGVNVQLTHGLQVGTSVCCGQLLLVGVC